MFRRSATPSRKPSSSSTTRTRRFGAPFLEPPDFTCRVSYTVAMQSRQDPRDRLDLPRCLQYIGPPFWRLAEVVELVDTPDSGSGGGNPVEVRVLSSALHAPGGRSLSAICAGRGTGKPRPVWAGLSRLEGR